MLISFLKNRNKCRHKKITPFSPGSFCPDCGKEIKITWVILRCSCCQTKRHVRVFFNSLHPRDKFCIKCGESGCYEEKKESIEFYDFQYAAISKKEVSPDAGIKEILQVWIEKEPSQNDIVNNFKLIPVLY